MDKKVMLVLDEKTHKDLKIFCVSNSITINEFIVKLIKEKLN
jgi:predicted HicB family RNase H-like nuclease